MLLRHSHTSPFVRKVTVLLHETGLAQRVSYETVADWRGTHPRLAAWLAEFARRPSMVATAPPA